MLPSTCQNCGNGFSEFDVNCPTCGTDLDPQRQGHRSTPSQDGIHKGLKFHFCKPEAWMLGLQNPIEQADYEVFPKMEEGDWGAIYPIKDHHLQREALLWVVAELAPHPDNEPDREAALYRASEISHPNVASIYDIVPLGRRQGVILEGNGFRTLDQRRPADGFSKNEAMALAKQACSALEAVHEAGLSGWDLDSSNWFLDHQSHLKLSPHGLKWAHQRKPSPARPISGSELKRQDLAAFGTLLGYLFRGPSYLPKSTGNKPVGPPQPIAALIQRCQTDCSLTLAQIKEVVSGTPDRAPKSIWRWLSLIPITVLALWFLFQWQTRETVTKESRPNWSVAVLPFQIIGGEPSQKAFGDGLGFGLERVLAREIEGNGVWVLNSKDFQELTPRSTPQLNQSFGIDWVLTGNLRQENNQWRLTLLLLEARSSRQLDQRVLVVDQSDPQDLFRQMLFASLSLLKWESPLSPKSQAFWDDPKSPSSFESTIRGLGFLTGSQLTHARAAQQSFERALEKDPNYVPAKLGRAAALLTQLPFTNERQSLLKILDKPITEDPKWARDWRVLNGQMHMELEQWNSAAKDYEVALMKDANNPDLGRMLAKVYSRLEQYEGALAQYNQILNEFPDHSPTLGELAVLYNQLQRADEHSKTLDKLRQHAPEHPTLVDLPTTQK